MSKVALLIVALGCWLIATALTFDNQALICSINDIVTGVLLIICGLFSLAPDRMWSKWFVGLLGIWLQLAPLVLWAPSAWIYLNDTVIGAIIIVFSFLLSTREKNEKEQCPRGWSYNPSSWSHRIPTVCLAMLCLFFSRYMAAYQLGYISSIWDPFFPDGTFRVITSDISQSFPISDAGLGALCYTLEAVLGWQGDRVRFATMPWLVFLFAFLVIPVGVVSIALIILQPVIVGAWCSWCLATAFSMLLMIVLTAGECAAGFQFLKDATTRGESFWRVFWQGSSAVPLSRPKRCALGISIPWNLFLCAAVGVGLMVGPRVFNIQGALGTSDYIEGPIIIAIAIISTAEVFRALRYALVILGGWLFVIPWLFSFAAVSPLSLYHHIAGIFLVLLALRKGPIKETYGAWERYIV